jgi:nitrate reductase (cytochrome), electron transfer subunit
MRSGEGTGRNVLLIGVATTAMAAAILVLGGVFLTTHETPMHAPARLLEAGTTPIAAEADVFRTRFDELAVDASAARRPEAHPRTLATYRALRAYPGAPPRIPHGLTSEELLRSTCNTCHERGGYVARFAAYAPVTPHPQYQNCLQCHAPDDAVTGIGFPDRRTGAVCLQCHVLDSAPPIFVALDWRPAEWPEIGRTAMEGSPPVIPHELHLRGNCVACHTGPGAVEELRTDHPDRGNCRQCHLTVMPNAGTFTRPVNGSATARSGAGP